MSRRGRKATTTDRAHLPAVTVLSDRPLSEGDTVELVVTARVGSEGRLDPIEGEVRWDAPAC